MGGRFGWEICMGGRRERGRGKLYGGMAWVSLFSMGRLIIDCVLVRRGVRGSSEQAGNGRAGASQGQTRTFVPPANCAKGFLRASARPQLFSSLARTLLRAFALHQTELAGLIGEIAVCVPTYLGFAFAVPINHTHCTKNVASRASTVTCTTGQFVPRKPIQSATVYFSSC